MEQEKQPNEENLEQIRREKRKKRFWHYLFVYLICLLAAFVVWLLVHYNMRTTEERAAAKEVCAYDIPETDVWQV